MSIIATSPPRRQPRILPPRKRSPRWRPSKRAARAAAGRSRRLEAQPTKRGAER